MFHQCFIYFTGFSLLVALFLFQFTCTDAGSELSTDMQSFSLDTKFYTESGKTDCYYQYVYMNHVLYLEYKVLKGGDGLIGMSIMDPNGNYIMPTEWKEGGNYHNENIQVPGYYAFCLDNQFSKFSAKLVSVYISTYNARDWERYTDEWEQLEMSVGNSTASLVQVNSRVTQMLKHLFVSRAVESRDYLVLEKNNFYVNFFSVLQCVIIIVAGYIHVKILKSLFKEQTHGKLKVRL